MIRTESGIGNTDIRSVTPPPDYEWQHGGYTFVFAREAPKEGGTVLTPAEFSDLLLRMTAH